MRAVGGASRTRRRRDARVRERLAIEAQRGVLRVGRAYSDRAGNGAVGDGLSADGDRALGRCIRRNHRHCIRHRRACAGACRALLVARRRGRAGLLCPCSQGCEEDSKSADAGKQSHGHLITIGLGVSIPFVRLRPRASSLPCSPPAAHPCPGSPVHTAGS